MYRIPGLYLFSAIVIAVAVVLVASFEIEGDIRVTAGIWRRLRERWSISLRALRLLSYIAQDEQPRDRIYQRIYRTRLNLLQDRCGVH